MPSLIAGSDIFVGHSNSFSSLLPSAGSNRLFFIGYSHEGSGLNVADEEIVSITYRGETGTVVEGAWAGAANARGIQLFVFNETQIQGIEAGSGDPVLSRSAGPVSGAISHIFCCTFENCDQGAITAVKVENLNTNGGDPFPHEITVAATSGDLVLAFAHLTQNGVNTWSGGSEIAGQNASTTHSTSIGAQTAASTGNVTLGVTSDAGASYATAIIGMSISAAVATFSVDSISAGPHYVGDTVTLTVSNASASGKTLSIPAGSLPVDSQSTSQMTFTVPDPKTFGNQTSPYSSNILITATDGVENDTINFQISPTVGHYFETITATTGIYADDVGVAIGDRGYGYWLTGTGDAYLTVGSLNAPSGGTFRYWIQDDTDSVWGNYADEIILSGEELMAISFIETLRNNQLDEVTALIDAGAGVGKLKIYDGTRPATGGAVTTQTLLAEPTFSATSFPAASGGSMTANAITSDSSANATGTATWFRCTDSNDNAVIDGDIADLNLNTNNITAGLEVAITSAIITAGNS